MNQEEHLNESSLDVELQIELNKPQRLESESNSQNLPLTCIIVPEPENNNEKKPDNCLEYKIKKALNKEKAVMKTEFFDPDMALKVMSYLLTLIHHAKGEKLRTNYKAQWTSLRHFMLCSNTEAGLIDVYYFFSRKMLLESEDEFHGSLLGYTFSLHSEEVRYGGSQNLPMWVRGALYGKFYHDLEIRNCYISIILNIQRLYFPDFTCRFIEYYVKRKQKVINYIILRYKINETYPNLNLSGWKEIADNLLKTLMMGNSEEKWFSIHGLSQTRVDHSINIDGDFSIDGFKKEIETVAGHVWSCYDSPSSIKIKTYVLRSTSKKSLKMKYLARIIKDIARQIVMIVEQTLITNGRAVDAYLFGHMYIKKRYKKDSTIARYCEVDIYRKLAPTAALEWEESLPSPLLDCCISAVQSTLGLNIQLNTKSFDCSFLSISQNSSLVKPIQLRKTYEEIKYLNEEYYGLGYIEDVGLYNYKSVLKESSKMKDAIRDARYNKREDTLIESYLTEVSPQNGQRRRKIEYFSFWNFYKEDAKRTFYKRVVLDLSKTSKEGDYYDFIYSHEVGKDFIQFTGFALELEGKIKHSILPITQPFEFSSYVNYTELPFKPLFEDTLFLGEIEHSWRVVPLLNHIFILLGKNQTDFEYLVRYFADIIQNPTVRKGGVAILLYSEKQGNGKSTLVQMLGRLCNPYFGEVNKLQELVCQFTTTVGRKLLIHVEDPTVADLLAHADELKFLITSETCKQESKFQMSTRSLNRARFFITTNSANSIKFGPEDRRYVQLPCSGTLKGNKKYFEEIRDYWNDRNNLLASFNFFKNLDLTNFDFEIDKPFKPMLENKLEEFLVRISIFLSRDEIYAKSFPKYCGAEGTAKSWIWIAQFKLWQSYRLWISDETQSAHSLKNHEYTQIKFTKALKELSTEERNYSNVHIKSQTHLPVDVERWVNKGKALGFKDIDQLDLCSLILRVQNESISKYLP